MSALVIAVVLILVLSVFLGYPLLRGTLNPEYFFTSGARTRSKRELRRLVLLENLRDLRVEKEHGKLTDAEFQELALPLARELEELQENSGAQAAEIGSVTRNRLGILCSRCGALTSFKKTSAKDADEKDIHTDPEYCVQCGYDFPYEA